MTRSTMETGLISIWSDLAFCVVYATATVGLFRYPTPLGIGGHVAAILLLLWTVWNVAMLADRYRERVERKAAVNHYGTSTQ